MFKGTQFVQVKQLIDDTSSCRILRINVRLINAPSGKTNTEDI